MHWIAVSVRYSSCETPPYSILTASNPQAPTAIVRYCYADGEFKTVAAGAHEQTAIHTRLMSGVLHVDSAEAADQRAAERAFRQAADDKRHESERTAAAAMASATEAVGSGAAEICLLRWPWLQLQLQRLLQLQQRRLVATKAEHKL